MIQQTLEQTIDAVVTIGRKLELPYILDRASKGRAGRLQLELRDEWEDEYRKRA